MTNNLRLRIAQHNGFFWGGAKYTQSHRPVKLVYFEKLNSRKEAGRRELEIKNLSHSQKMELVAKANIEDGKVVEIPE